MDKSTLWKIIAAFEVVLAAAVVILDLFIPTIVILGLIFISLVIRRQGLSNLGFKKSKNMGRMAAAVFLWVIVWTLLHLALFMPILNRLTGTTQDLSAYENLEGNLGQLALYLVLTWTLAAFGEEMVYRGHLQRRIRDVFGNAKTGILLAIVVSSILFGLAHTEQGLIGVIVTAMDAVFFSWLKRRHNDNLWASVLAHGFSNTVGLVAFFFVGPIYGFW